jgi:hypothetical protein
VFALSPCWYVFCIIFVTGDSRKLELKVQRLLRAVPPAGQPECPRIGLGRVQNKVLAHQPADRHQQLQRFGEALEQVRGVHQAAPLRLQQGEWSVRIERLVGDNLEEQLSRPR